MTSMEEYPSLVEGTGLENREVVRAAQGFESLFLRHYIAGWSSSVARRAHNPEVGGSNPSPATNLVSWCSWLTRLPVTQKIAGSSPVETAIWLHSSVGRARDWKSLCRWFDSRWSHHLVNFIFLYRLVTYFALVAQLDRVFGYEPKGQGFESLRAHHIGKWLNLVEHLVWDQGVAGSNPVFPTIRF